MRSSKNANRNGRAARPPALASALMSNLTYSDDYIAEILDTTKTIAIVGASPNWVRPSHFAMKYLQRKGYRVIPVNPVAAGTMLLDEKVFTDLTSIPVQIDMVDIFRNSEAAGAITDEAIGLAKDKGIKTIWMQLGVRNDEAAARAEQADLNVVMDRCPKIEFGRLYSELSWSGVNSGIISAKRPRLKRSA